MQCNLFFYNKILTTHGINKTNYTLMDVNLTSLKALVAALDAFLAASSAVFRASTMSWYACAASNGFPARSRVMLKRLWAVNYFITQRKKFNNIDFSRT